MAYILEETHNFQRYDIKLDETYPSGEINNEGGKFCYVPDDSLDRLTAKDLREIADVLDKLNGIEYRFKDNSL